MFDYKELPKLNIARLIIFSLAVSFGMPLSAAEGMSMPPKEVLLKRTVEWPANKLQAKVIRVSFPPGHKTPWHSHKGPGPRYVVKGDFKIVEGASSKTYSAGQVFWESGGRMSAQNIGQGEGELVIFELAPAK